MRHIGNIRLGPINKNHKHGPIGLIIGDRDKWGIGVATEAIVLVTRFGFRELGLQKISAACYESNIGSKRAFEKAGYKIEGFKRNHLETLGGREGAWQMGVLTSDIIESE